MGRPETPVDQTVPQRAALAEFLRRRRDARGITYAQMAVGHEVSAATLKRAASGRTVPRLEAVRMYVLTTRLPAEEDMYWVLKKARRLWTEARFATQRLRYASAGHYRMPDPLLVNDQADLSRALRDLHAACGVPSPGEMQMRAGRFGVLPRSTARRILQGRTLPGSEAQLAGFLRACGVTENDRRHDAWLRAFERARTAEERREIQERARKVEEWADQFPGGEVT